MAYINGTWIDRESREKRIELVTETLRKLAAVIKSGKGTEYHVEQLRTYKAELTKLKRVHRAEVDVAYFAYEYLSDGANAENEDNIIQHAEDKPHDPIEKMAPIHREFYNLCDHVNHEDRSARLAIAAARGNSKSGVFSNTFPLHQTVFRRRKYILVISETDNLSKKLIGWVNKQIKFNEKIRADFGPLLDVRNQQNEKDNEEAFITTTNTLVEASSSGKQLRGKRHGSYRPDLVVIDDPSSMNNEGTKEAREKLNHWFNAVVMPIGSKSTSIVVVGTIVSATGLLSTVLARKDFKSSFHSAIVSEPTNPQLWEQYCEIYARADDMSEPNAFYEANKEKLEEGVELAWSWRWTYRALMHEKVNMGSKAFNSEYRNLAFSEDEQFFFPEKYAKFHFTYDSDVPTINYEGKQYRVSDLTIAGAWDISMGKNRRSDYNAIIVVGKHESSGLLFVLDEYATKEPPHVFIDVVLKKIAQWRITTFSVETINAYHEFYRQLQEKARIECLNYCRINDIKSHKSSKEQRIESLEPLFYNKTLILNDRHTTLIDQLSQYPFGDHDDSADSLTMCVDNILRPVASVVAKPAYL